MSFRRGSLPVPPPLDSLTELAVDATGTLSLLDFSPREGQTKLLYRTAVTACQLPKTKAEKQMRVVSNSFFLLFFLSVILKSRFHNLTMLVKINLTLGSLISKRAGPPPASGTACNLFSDVSRSCHTWLLQVGSETVPEQRG